MIPELQLELEWRGRRYESVRRGLTAIAVKFDKDLDAYTTIARRTLDAYMRGVVISVQRRTAAPYPSGTSPAGTAPGRLSRRSGALYASLSPDKIVVTPGGFDGVEIRYTLSGIAAVHERGATITPKKAKFLTVPLPAALRPNGVPILSKARDWKDTFIIKSKKGNLLIMQRRGKEAVPLYVLKKKVVIPPRLQFGDAFNAGKDFLADALAADLLKEFQNG